jgi:aryl-alcohol dehydrogenase-like predicted oxidoreductase
VSISTWFTCAGCRRSQSPSISASSLSCAAGLISELGVSSITSKHLAEAQAIAPVVAVQNRLSLDVRVNDEVLRLCTERGIAFVAYYAIAGDGRESGFDAGTKHQAVAEVAAAHGASVAQIRLAWTLHQGPNVLAIPGTSSLKHLEENVAAGDLHLTDQELERLER